MARKKTSSDWPEEQDDAAMEGEVVGVTDDGASPGDPVNVKITEKKPAASEPAVSPTTRAEQEAGRKALEEREASKQAETGSTNDETT